MKGKGTVLVLGVLGIGAIALLAKRASASPKQEQTAVDKTTSKVQSKMAPVQAKAQSYVDKAKSYAAKGGKEAQSLADKLKAFGI